MLQGIGDTYAKTTSLAGGATAQKMVELFLFEFEFTEESETLEAQAYVGGVRRTKSTGESSVTSTLTLRSQYADWAQLGFYLDELPVIRDDVTIPILKRATVPSGSPYEIVDAAIVAGTAAQVFVYVNAQGTWGQPGSLVRAAGAPAVGEVQVDAANTKLVFNAAQAGATITYTMPQVWDDISTYGGSGTPTKYGKIEFWGKVYTPESANDWVIYFPELTRQSRPTISFTGDVPTLEAQFGAVTPSGWDKPFQLFNKDTGAIA